MILYPARVLCRRLQVVEEHRKYMRAHNLDIRGRIYISSQGINAQFGGTKEHALQYTAWLKDQELWQVCCTVSCLPARVAHPTVH